MTHTISHLTGPTAAAGQPDTRALPATGVRRVLLDTGYNLSAFPLGLVAFVTVVVGVSVSAGLMVLVAGVFALTLTVLVARGFAHVERARMRSMLGIDVPSAVYAVPRDGAGPWQTVTTTLRDPQSYLDALWSILGFVTGTVAFVVTVTWWGVTGGGLTYWFWERFVPAGDSAGDEVHPAEWLGLGHGREADSWLYLAVGIAALVMLPLVVRACAATHAGLAGALLNTRAELRERAAQESAVQESAA